MLFKREINPYSVTDKISFRNLDQTLELKVRADGSTIVVALKSAYDRLSKLKDDTPEEERLKAAKYFAETIFGKEQAEKIAEFYNNDSLAIISACGMYFRERLGKKITKAQKK